MEDQIEIADTLYPKGVVWAAGDRQGHVALHIQDGDQLHNGTTNVALPHDQMLLSVVAPWFASLENEEQKKVLSTLYEQRETRFPRQPRPVEADHAPNDYDLGYLQEKGWLWHPAEQGTTPFTALMYHDGLTLRTEQAVVTIPKHVVLDLISWVISHSEWFESYGANYQADPQKDTGGYLNCVYCFRNLPHTEQQHDEQIEAPSHSFYDDGVSPDPIDGQY